MENEADSRVAVYSWEQYEEEREAYEAITGWTKEVLDVRSLGQSKRMRLEKACGRLSEETRASEENKVRERRSDETSACEKEAGNEEDRSK